MNNKRGQAILELIVAVGVVAIIITGLINAVTASLRFGQASRSRSRAVKLAQEAIEVTRNVRDSMPWSTFLTYAGTGTKKWCLDATTSWTVSDSSGTCPITVGDPLWRSVEFTWSDPVMKIVVDVTWDERSGPTAVQLTTNLTQW